MERDRPKPPRRSRIRPATVDFRRQIERDYGDRQAAFRWQLLEQDAAPDWTALLGFHLQMCELEALLAGLEELSCEE